MKNQVKNIFSPLCQFASFTSLSRPLFTSNSFLRLSAFLGLISDFPDQFPYFQIQNAGRAAGTAAEPLRDHFAVLPHVILRRKSSVSLKTRQIVS